MVPIFTASVTQLFLTAALHFYSEADSWKVLKEINVLTWWSFGSWLLGSISRVTNHRQVLRVQHLDIKGAVICDLLLSVLLVHVSNSNGVPCMHIKQMSFVCMASWRSTTCNKIEANFIATLILENSFLSLLFWKVGAMINIYSVV